ncbi:PREDICTED: uncharacterized protein LOC107331213 isoform X5 [Acropora digitifera]|uniref:uncharacterized protein LOC107331213 isoform X5 n=1 Tax=Acropora digitifera TaxID=70779 RepID=UPI00077AF290|nr:PREDICTED: uncharacterized protein LOC107331213 isoform X5 [Acropora digitifera]
MEELEIEKEKMGEMLQQQLIQQSEQEEKIKRLCNMISSAGRKDSSEETVARVCSFLHSSFVDLFRELLAGDVGQAPVIQS